MSNINEAIARAEARAPYSYFEQLVCRQGKEIFVIEDHELDLVTMAQVTIIARVAAGLSDEDQGSFDFDGDDDFNAEEESIGNAFDVRYLEWRYEMFGH